MISIIIPTLNEENYLPKLLQSIKQQVFKEKYEVIVADGKSRDSTRSIAKKFGCRIVKGGKQSVGINNAAKAAKGHFLLILDADAIMPTEFLMQNLNDFRKRKLDAASCYIDSIGGNAVDKIMHATANIYYFLFKGIKPYVPSFCFFIKKKFFLEIGGFDENVPWLIDLAFSNSLPKKTKYGMLPVRINLSLRMAERLGRFGQARLMFLAAFLRTIGKNYYGEYKWKGKPLERIV